MKSKRILIVLTLFLGLSVIIAYGLGAGASHAGSKPAMVAQAGPEAVPTAPAEPETKTEPAPAAPEAKPEPAPAPAVKPAPKAETASAAPRGREPHGDYAQMKIRDCTGCHRGMGVPPNHGADWSREHRLSAARTGGNCNDCHEQSFCLDCHTGGGIEPDLTKSLSSNGEYMPNSHRSDFISLHPLKAKDNLQTCYRCHDAVFCYDCHSRVQSNTLNVKSHTKTQTGQDFIWTAEHAREARRNLQSCQTCHPNGNVCLPCHSAIAGSKVNPHPKDWDGSKLKSKGGDRSCRVCH